MSKPALHMPFCSSYHLMPCDCGALPSAAPVVTPKCEVHGPFTGSYCPLCGTRENSKPDAVVSQPEGTIRQLYGAFTDALSEMMYFKEMGEWAEGHENTVKRLNELANLYCRKLASPTPVVSEQAEPIDGKFGWLNGQIVNLVSGEAIPKDEPLFLLRGRDHVAYNAITAYLSECEESGCNELHLAGIGQVRDRFAQFAIDHPERMKQPGITRHLKLASAPPSLPKAGETEQVNNGQK